MRIYGNWTEVDNLVFREDLQAITLRPNANTTYTADRIIELPNIDADDEIVSLNATQLLTNKTLTTPKLTDAGAGDLVLTSSHGALTADRTLSLNVQDADRTIDLGGNLTLASDFITVGANSITLTTTGVTSLILPTTGTLATLDGTETLTNKTIIIDDNKLTLQDEADNTKQLQFQLSNLSPSTTRTLSVPDIDDEITTNAATQTLTNKIIIVDDANLTLQNTADNTKQLKFNLSNISPVTARTLTVPDVDDTIVTLAATQELSNKTLVDPKIFNNPVGSLILQSLGILTSDKALSIDVNDGFRLVSLQGDIILGGNLITGGTFNVNGPNQVDLNTIGPTSLTLPTVGTLATTSEPETFTNKIIIIDDDKFTLQDEFDNTKKVQFSLTGISPNTTRSISIPDVNDTLVTLTATQTLYNKTLSFPKLVDSGVASLTLASTSGTTADRTLTLDVNDGDRLLDLGGNVTIPADFIISGNHNLTLNLSGVTSLSLPTTGTLATLAGVETLSNKTFDTDTTFTSTGAIKVPAGTTVQRPATPVAGMLRFNSDAAEFEGYNGAAWGAIGSGGGGTGDASTLLETLKNQLQDSVYQYLTPSVFSLDQDSLVDPSSTGSYNGTTKSFEFTNANETLISKQLLDADFLDENVDIAEAEVSVKWDPNKSTTLATYELSRDGGNFYETMSMTQVGQSSSFVGSHKFKYDVELTAASVQDSTSPSTLGFSSSDFARAQQFELKQETKLGKIGTYLGKLGPTIQGNAVYKIVADSNGTPDLGTVLYASSLIPLSSLPQIGSTDTVGITYASVSSSITFPAGVYWFVIEPDPFYQAYLIGGGTDLLAINVANPTVATAHQLYDGSTWTAQSNPLFIDLQTIVGTSLSSHTANDTSITVNNTNVKAVSQPFTLSETDVINSVDLFFSHIGGVAGGFTVSIKSDNAGDPGTTTYASRILNTSDIPRTDQERNALIKVDLGPVVLTAGTYHLVLESDAAYQADYVASTKEIRLKSDTAGTPVAKTFDGTTWSAATSQLYYDIRGRKLDLRLKVTSTEANKALEGFGVFYDPESGAIISDTVKIQKFVFKAVADNLNEFTLTNFTPHPDFLKVYYVEAGQVFKYGAFTLQGTKVVFPANTFNNGGVETTVTLIMMEESAGVVDNSDNNALLLAANHLGSTDTTLDKSVAGRGIFLRRPDGTLREISIDNTDNIIISPV